MHVPQSRVFYGKGHVKTQEGMAEWIVSGATRSGLLHILTKHLEGTVNVVPYGSSIHSLTHSCGHLPPYPRSKACPAALKKERKKIKYEGVTK